MPYFPLSPLEALAKAYPRLTSVPRLKSYTTSRLPAELRSMGDLVPIGGGTGRIPFALGDDLIVKTARMPRGIKENMAEGDWVAPVPEAVWKSDDDLVAVVRRANKADAQLKRDVKSLQPYLFLFGQNPERSPEFQEKLSDIGFGDLLNYNPLWGDLAPRNVGLKPSAERVPLLLDAGILDRSIMEPSAVRDTISPADWLAYRRDVLRAKRQGGLVSLKE